MTFLAEIETEMTKWVSRNAVFKSADADAVQKTAAATFAAQQIQDKYGEVLTGVGDEVALQHAVLLAARFLRNYISFKVDSDMERAMKAVDAEIETERKRRRQRDVRAHQTNRTDATLATLFPDVTD